MGDGLKKEDEVVTATFSVLSGKLFIGTVRNMKISMKIAIFWVGC